MMNNSIDILTDLIAKVRAKGADSADAVSFSSSDLSVARRFGKPEELERSESMSIGLRAFIGKKQAIVSTSDIGNLEELTTRVVDMARVAPEDEFSALANRDILATEIKDLDSFDATEPSAEEFIKMADKAEETALAYEGITNSEGADAGYSSSKITLATSNGFAKSYAQTYFNMSVSVLAGVGQKMERDYEYTVACFLEDLMSPETVGKIAAENTLKRLNPRKVKTCQVPVVFSPRVSKSLVGYFAGSISGSKVARKTSFLQEKMGSQLFNPSVNIIDNPHIIRGLSSKPFDAEGVANSKLELVKDGVLQTWLLDIRSANQLGLKTNGCASRSIASQPSPSTSNLYMEAGDASEAELISDIKNGLYVTETFGMGVNTVSGDYSQGAVGFWIENGQISYPVSEITIAGNLVDMYGGLTPANNLEFKYSTNCPTVRIEKMTVAGS